MTHTNYAPNGSRTTGNGYAVAILRSADDPTRYGVALSLVGLTRVQLDLSYVDAYEMMRRFCECCHAWNTAQSIRRWLDASPNHAIIGRF